VRFSLIIAAHAIERHLHFGGVPSSDPENDSLMPSG
jgi:hypothetical protein